MMICLGLNLIDNFVGMIVELLSKTTESTKGLYPDGIGPTITCIPTRKDASYV